MKCSLIGQLLVLWLALAGAGHAADVADCGHGKTIPVEHTRDATVYRHEYCNSDYAFSAKLPEGFAAVSNLPPNPNHGFGIDLEDPEDTRAWEQVPPARYVWIDASYNTEAETLARAADRVVEQASQRVKGSASGALQFQQANMTLAGQPAIRLRVELRNKRSTRVELYLLTLRKENDVLYTVSLVTNAASYPEDLTVFEKLVTGLSFDAVHKP